MSKFITVVTSHFVYIYCLAGYSQPSNIWTLVKPTSSPTFTSYIASKISSSLSSTSKISSIVSLTSIPILITITLFLNLSFLWTLSNCLPPLPLLNPPLLLGGVTSGFQGFTRFVPEIC